MKKCIRCELDKNESEFHKSWRNKKKTKFNLSSYCIECSHAINKEYRDKNREYLRIKRKEYWKKRNENWKTEAIIGIPSHDGSNFKRKEKCRQRTILLLKQGKVKKNKFCQICGKENKMLDAHHSNYDFPEIFITICRPCHLKLHWNILNPKK